MMRILLSLVILTSLTARCTLAAEPVPAQQRNGANMPWTFAEAYAQAKLHRDGYASYVAVNLAAATGIAEKHRAIRGRRPRPGDNNRELKA